MEPTDKECVESSRDGAPDDFRLLVARYQKPLFAYLSGRLGDELEAEEAAQESFVRAFLSLKKLRKPESFYSWLLGIASRVLKERFRFVRKHTETSLSPDLVLQAEEPTVSQDYSLEEAIADLPETYRQVIVLRFYEELSCQQVAQRLGMPIGTVTKMLSRAYTMLREELSGGQSHQITVNYGSRL